MYDKETQKRINELFPTLAGRLEAQWQAWFAALEESNRVLLARLRRAQSKSDES